MSLLDRLRRRPTVELPRRVFAGLTYEQPSTSESEAESLERLKAAMAAEFPGHSWEVLRTIYKPWTMRSNHRLFCPRCSAHTREPALTECEIGAYLSGQIARGLGVRRNSDDRRPELSEPGGPGTQIWSGRDLLDPPPFDPQATGRRE